MSEIKLENICYVYGAGTPYEIHALKDVNMTFENGKITGLIGHTGSGKSTLVELLNGILKPTSGRVLLDGRDIWEEPKKIRDIRFRVGVVMQYPEYQLFEETVRADISFGPKNMGLSSDEIADRVMESAEFVGLDESLLDKSPFELSGGQKRRAAIAGVIAMRPEVLVLDEPAAGLDPLGRESILSKICEYNRRSGVTVIIVSHNMEDMAVFCDKIAVMSNGENVMYGDRDEIFSRRDELLAVDLGVPLITDVAYELSRLGVPVPDNIYTVERAKESILAILDGKDGMAGGGTE
ncbi:MAG: energy-coupling factor transporter ATPase [Firmicutes bacterium]|nr:energy-coupling factor transporter ATPase [Bacillota bacterium]